MSARPLKSLPGLGLLLSLATGPARAQVGQGELTGEIRDQSGTVIPGARVTATAAVPLMEV